MNIAISRTDAIGDVVMTFPLCGILKQQVPDCHISFIGRNYTRAIIEKEADVDSFVSYSDLEMQNDAQLTASLQALHLDAIIFVFPNKRLARLAHRAGIAIRIGTSHRLYNLTHCNRTINFTRRRSHLNEAQLNVKLLTPLVQLPLFTLQQLTDFVHLKNITPTPRPAGSPFRLIIHPKSHKSAREYSWDNYKRLIDLLPSDMEICLCGTEEEGAGITIQRPNVKAMFGRFTLNEYISFIASCDCFVACSTGPLHLAAVMGCHTIGLYPSIHPLDPSRWHPLGKHVKVFAQPAACHDCKNSVACHCINNITPEQIAEEILHNA